MVSKRSNPLHLSINPIPSNCLSCKCAQPRILPLRIAPYSPASVRPPPLVALPAPCRSHHASETSKRTLT